MSVFRATTVGQLIDVLAQYPPDLLLDIEEEGEGAVGHELQDHGNVNGHLVLVFPNVIKES